LRSWYFALQNNDFINANGFIRAGTQDVCQGFNVTTDCDERDDRSPPPSGMKKTVLYLSSRITVYDVIIFIAVP
jgi:hypothetical protein